MPELGGVPMRLIMPRAVPAGWPPDVVPRQLIESAHINKIRDSVHTWPGDINANRKTLSQVGQIVIYPIAGVQRFGITNDAGTGWDWFVDSAGNLSSPTFKSIGSITSVQFADATTQTTAYKGVAANQTPWLQAINGNGQTLNAAGSIVIYSGVGGNPRFGVLNAAFDAWHWKIDTADNLVSDTGRSLYVTAGTVYARTLQAQTTASTWPFVVLNAAGNNQDWLINAAGDFASGTGRNITTAGSISGVANITATGSVDITAPGGGVYPLWVRRNDSQASWYVSDVGLLGSNIGANIATAGNINGNIFTASRVAINHTGQVEPFLITGAGGAEWAVWGSTGDMHAGAGKSLFLESGDIWARNFVAQAGAGLVCQGAAGAQVGRLSNAGLQIGYDLKILWGDASEYYSAPDLEISRFAAGSLWIRNPATGTGAAVNCQVVSASAYVSAEGFRIYSTGATGVGTTFATGDGRTATVVGGIITRIQ